MPNYIDTQRVNQHNESNHRLRRIGMHIGEHTPATYMASLHTHKELEVGLCLEGEGWFYFGQKKYEVRAGDVFVVNAGVEPHIAQADPVHPSNYYFLSFESSAFSLERQQLLLPFVYRSDRFANRIPAELPAARQIGMLMRQFMDEYSAKQEAFESMLEGLLLQICALLVRHYGQTAPDGEWPRTMKRFEYLQPGLAYVKEHFREPITAKEVASHMALSISRTLHLFTETLGIGLQQYVLQLRLNEAMTLLATTDHPATDIGLASGFQSLASFYRNFTTIVGVSPQEFRKKSSLLAVFEKHSASLEKLNR